MLVIIFRRLGQSILVLFIVALISFLIFRYVGNPVDNLMGQEATLAQRAALIEALGLNDPFYKQYFNFIWKALQFDFGNSYRGALPVSELIASRLPATIELAVTSAFFALVLGVIIGIYTAINRGGYIANLILSTSLIGVSLPTFLIGFNLIWQFDKAAELMPLLDELNALDLPAPKVGATFDFEDLPNALRLFQTGQTTGKVVVRV